MERSFCYTKDNFQNRSKRFGSDFIEFLELEHAILNEHFPILFEHPDYLSKVRIRSQVQKEAESIDSAYSILTKELSKIALSQLSLQKEIHTLPSVISKFSC